MPFKLRVHFEGLIGFVPLSDGEEAQGMLALLVDARAARLASDGAHLAPHFPVLRCHSANIVKNGLSTDLDDSSLQKRYFVSETGSNPFIDWFLDQQEIGIRHEGASGPLEIWDEDSGTQRAGKTREHFFSYVPRIEAFVDPVWLVPRPKRGALAARFRISEGFLQSKGTEKDKEHGGEVLIDLRPLNSEESAGSKGRAVSSGAILEVDVPGSSVVLTTTSFKSGITTDAVHLAPVPSADLVEVRVRNLPLEDLLELPGMGHATASIDRHFELFYELCAQRPPLRKTPVPHVRMNGTNGTNGGSAGHDHAVTGPIRVSDITCPPAVFIG